MQIASTGDLKRFISLDLKERDLSGWPIVQDPIARWVIGLRLAEYTGNCWRTPAGRRLARVVHYLVKHAGVRLGYTIPENTFGPGLSLAHWGTIVVNRSARIGPRCRVHVGVNIGTHKGGAPTIGADCYIGPGAKIFGPITLGDRVIVGANAVVTRSFGDDAVLVGIPARDISDSGEIPDFVGADNPL